MIRPLPTPGVRESAQALGPFGEVGYVKVGKPFEDGFRRQSLDWKAEPPLGTLRLAACGKDGRAVAEALLKIAKEKLRG
ncbi:hypothetical protein Pogu_1664 [Pyrobaculum oguniense TE7]|uniref:Uncharacterized protein n=1 Tax=Pyrobaculum oguniense (strain DSM 13380 / JCM 10595 / TE7) TaxID=698757 RepID=H6QAR5_PYROT|nr:hypothetical protein Pogu_1664 [Pyrobaculum oguniense TE7]